MSDKIKFDIYSDVVTHDIYDIMTKDLTKEEKTHLNAVLKQFTEMLEAGIVRPGYELMERCRDELAQDMVEDVVEEMVKEQQAEDAEE